MRYRASSVLEQVRKEASVADRQATARRKSALLSDLRAAIARAELRPGDQITPLRELVETYKLSKPTILQALQPMVDSGVLRSVPSVGIFVASPENSREGCHVLLTPPVQENKEQTPLVYPVMHGFEERIASFGGHSVILSSADFLSATTQRALPPVLGVFSFMGGRDVEVDRLLPAQTPQVRYLGAQPVPVERVESVSYVDLDNVAGGRLAAQQMLRNGFRDIAFLGVHTDGESHFPWSRLRESGWEEAIQRSHPDAEIVRIRPESGCGDAPNYARAVELVARSAVKNLDKFSACVGADDFVLITLIRELREQNVPESQWPAMVGFEGLAGAEDYVVSSVRPRWAEIGSLAAEILCNRVNLPTATIPEVNLVSMTVISRPVLRRRTSSSH